VLKYTYKKRLPRDFLDSLTDTHKKGIVFFILASGGRKRADMPVFMHTNRGIRAIICVVRGGVSHSKTVKNIFIDLYRACGVRNWLCAARAKRSNVDRSAEAVAEY
jgi:hypothetical protein